mmetsp:Transcript_32647/g.44830  ORF Transcript_32647/g.44830 Transcript_32647/m.44830 type:complete len:754 (+) Transcript_32647:57-2318(+)
MASVNEQRKKGRVVRTTKRGVAILSLDHPPLNSLSFGERLSLSRELSSALKDPSIRGVIVCGEGRAFCAGADITEFPSSSPSSSSSSILSGEEGERREAGLVKLLDRMEQSEKPVVALIHGFALGGGLEVALACHWRLANPTARLGLPEVDIGLLPGAGGTQRLPRLIGIEAASNIILSGKHIPAPQALKLGILDEIVGKNKSEIVKNGPKGIEEAVDFVLRKADLGRNGIRRICDMKIDITPEALDKNLGNLAKQYGRIRRGQPAVGQILKAVRGSATSKTFEEGIQIEQEAFLPLMRSSEAKGLQYFFFAQRAATKIPSVYSSSPARLRSVGVIGAGLMGGGIAMCCVNVGLNVILLDVNQQAVDRGLAIIKKNYATTVARGKMSQEQMDKRMSLIQGGTDYALFSDCDLVIEAVFEDLSLKKKIFEKLDKVCKQGAILASNTSALDIDQIASATSRPGDVIGCHFFSPANVMPLLENVRGKLSSPRTISTAMAFGSQIRKVPILVGNCPGFVANRVMAFYSMEARALAIEGAPIELIDKCAYDFGFSMGPFAMKDLVGIDLFCRQREKNGTLTPETSSDDGLYKMGRLGQKNGKGYYDYVLPQGAKKGSRPIPQPSKEVEEIIGKVARNLGIKQREKSSFTKEEIIQRLLFPVANEGMRVLEEGIVERASDVDIALVLGYNFPRAMGGVLHYVKSLGLPEVLKKMEFYQKEVSTGKEKYWIPSQLLVKAVSLGISDLDLVKTKMSPSSKL